jgi:thiol-disulfide isomerase/thioredoxin
MKPKTKIIIAIVVGIIVLIIAGIFITSQKNTGPKVLAPIEQFAQCIADSGAKFYGAFWCPHCAAQKQLFSKSASKLLPYVECSTPDSKGQTKICIDAGIKSYPTWVFTDGSTLSGEQSLKDLGTKTNCPLP